jgi:hypothetical protein
MQFSLCGLLLLLWPLALPITASPVPIDGQRAVSDVQFLASDSLQGRRSGLPGGEKAAAQIVEQFQSFGLKLADGDSSPFFRISQSRPTSNLAQQFWRCGRDM